MELYYYTTTGTMRLIITGGNIHATNVGYLNDSDEYINGLREIKSLLENAKAFGVPDLQKMAEDLSIDKRYSQIKRESSNIYSMSFSKARDLLSQWEMYAKESGVQIKMSFDGRRSYNYYQSQDEKKKETAKLKKRKVYYLTKIGMPPKEYHREGKKVLDEFLHELQKSGGDVEGEIVSIWKLMAPFIKNYGFKQENEVRAIFISDEMGLPIGYRPDRGALKPYLDIKMEKGWPICGIMVGPGRNQDQVFRSICHFLDHTELKIDKVTDTKIVGDYFEGMKEYSLPNDKIDQCKREVLKLTPSLLKLGVTYSEKILDTLQEVFVEENEKGIIQNYVNNNYFCNKGIIVNKSKWPYEF